MNHKAHDVLNHEDCAAMNHKDHKDHKDRNHKDRNHKDHKDHKENTVYLPL